jgi:hypothetical protein
MDKNIAAALAKFQSICPKVIKDSTNPHLKSRYAGLDSVLPTIKGPLAEAGLTFTQSPFIAENGAPILKTTITHIESGEFIQSIMPLLLVKQDSQALGSAITYARRYSLVSMLGLDVADEDDDGHAASAPAQAPRQQVKPAQAVHPLLAGMSAHKEFIIKNGDGQVSVAQASKIVLHKVKNYLDQFGVEFNGPADVKKIQGEVLSTVTADIEAAAAEKTWPWLSH